MKKVLFVLGEYIDGTAQNGLCVNDIKTCMEQNGYECHILCVEKKRYENFSNKRKHIYTIVNTEATQGLMNKYRQIVKFMHMPVGNVHLSKKIMKYMGKLYSNYDYDSIIAVVNPVESADALWRFKHKYKNARCIIYEIDPASNRYKNPKGIFQNLWYKTSMRWEIKVYNNVDHIVHMKTHYNHFSKREYECFVPKTTYLDIPSFKVLNMYSEYAKDSNTTVSFIYAGAFYPKLREPDYMIKLFDDLANKKDIRFDIYTSEAMHDYIKNIIKNNDKIKLNKLITQERLNKKIEKTNVLISVGNAYSDFLPSKVLYYIGTGKPIIHFYKDTSDVSNSYLEKYSRAILIDQMKLVTENIQRINEFLDSLAGNIIDTSQLYKLFHENTPEYSANKLMEVIDLK